MRIDPNGVHHTDPVFTTRASYTPDEPDSSSPWEEWMAGHKNQIYDVVGEALGEVTGPLERRIKELETQLAVATGALDILRGRGIPGTFNIRGTYNAKTAYAYLDVVAHDGASWVAKCDGPTEAPGSSADWQLVARQGKRGTAGERGPPGPAGAAPRFLGACFNKEGMHLATSTGLIPLFKMITVDPENFAIKFTAADDSTLSISLLPLFEAYHQQTSD